LQSLVFVNLCSERIYWNAEIKFNVIVSSTPFLFPRRWCVAIIQSW